MKKNFTLITILSILAIYTIIGFVAIPKILKPQLEKIINENITQKATLEKIEFNPFLLKFSIQNLKIADENETTLSIDKLYVDFSVITSIDERHIAFKDLKIVNPYINVIEFEDGTFNLEKLLKEKQEEKTTSTQESSSDIKFQIYKTALENARINFTKFYKDNKEPYKLNISEFNYTFYDMGTFRNSLASHKLRMLINQNSELIVNGGLRLDPFEMYGNVEFNNFKPTDFLSYEKELLNFNLNEKTFFNLRIGYKVDTKKDLNIVLNDGYLELNDIEIKQNEALLLSLKNLAIDNLNLEYPSNNIAVDSIVLNENITNLKIDKEGILNFSKLVVNSVKTQEEQKVNENQKVEEKQNPWKIALKKIELKNSNVNFDDNSTAISINNKNVNLSVDNLLVDGQNITNNSISLSSDSTTFDDNKNNINLINKNLNIQAKELSYKESTFKSNEISLKNSSLDFNDITNKLSIFTKESSLNLQNLLQNSDNISLSSVILNNPSIYISDKNNNMNILLNSISAQTDNFKYTKEQLALEKAKLSIPKVKFDDLKSKMNISSNDINIIATNTSMINDKIKVDMLSLTKPDFYLVDNKNDQTVVAKDLSIKINGITNQNNYLDISKINILEPNITINDKKGNTNIEAKNLYLNINEISHKNNKLSIKNSSINKPFISIVLGKSESKEEVKKEKAESKKVSKTKNEFEFDIGPIKINDMKMAFEDQTLPIPFKTDVTDLKGSFSRLHSSSSKPTKLELEGKVDEYGYTKITGTVDINDIKLLTDTNLLFKNIAIKNFTPYSGKFIGREIESGKLDLDLNYNIKKSDLKAENSIVISDIKLGKNVESPDAVNLPLELAIALLEDSNGVIDINLPVTGNIDDPQFSIAPIVWKLFTNLIIKAITSPFALLGAMLGVDADKIKSIEFAYGKSDILPSEKESLDDISKLLSKKPKLAIKVKPIYSPIRDKKTLQDIKFENFLIKKMEKIPEGDDYKEALEDFYDDLKDVKKLSDVKKLYTKKDEKGNEVFNNDDYVEYLRSLLASKQIVDENELINITKKRVENIQNYLFNVKKVPKDAIIIEDISKQDDEKLKWAVFSFDVSTR